MHFIRVCVDIVGRLREFQLRWDPMNISHTLFYNNKFPIISWLNTNEPVPEWPSYANMFTVHKIERHMCNLVSIEIIFRSYRNKFVSFRRVNSCLYRQWMKIVQKSPRRVDDDDANNSSIFNTYPISISLHIQSSNAPQPTKSYPKLDTCDMSHINNKVDTKYRKTKKNKRCESLVYKLVWFIVFP